MNPNYTLPDFVGEIYDTVLDPGLWEKVLEEVARYVGGRAASVFSKDETGNGGSVVYGFGLDPHYSQLYFEKYGRLDPIATGDAFVEPGVPCAVSDFIPYEQYRETTFYREWAEPQGLVDFVSCVLDKSTNNLTFLGVPRDERNGLIDDRARAHMQRIAPHVRRALSLGRVVDLGQTKAGMFAEILDGLGAAVFLIAPSGNIVHGNLAGRTILARGDFLHSVRGRLVVRDAAADRSLRAALAGANAGREAVGAASVAVPLISQDDERYVAHLLPLGDARHRAGIGNGAVAALFVQRATMAPPSPPEVIARYYGLTPTELRVLLAVVEVGGGPEVAERLGVADSTVKTHLHRLYQKTGTHGQVGLVKLVAGFSNPLRA